MAFSADRFAYVAFVGLRPAAIAVVLGTLGDRISRAGLIVTSPESRQNFKRLQGFFGGRVRCELIEVSEAIAAIGPVRAWLEQYGDNRPAFHVDPGFGYASALLSRRLVEAKLRPLLLSAPEGVLVTLDPADDKPPSSEPLADLGLDRLFALYGVTPVDAGTVDPTSVKTRCNIVLPGDLSGPTNGLTFTRAREVAGRLYGVVEGRDDAEPVRKLEGQLRARALNNLQPTVTICSTSPNARAEALSAGLNVVGRISDWDVPSNSAPVVGAPDSEAPRSVQGKGTDCKENLVVWMGRDVSATLTAIWTHKPDRAIVLGDSSHPLIGPALDRLHGNASALPVNHLIVVPRSFNGWFPSEAFADVNALAPQFNVTPGARLHVCMLAARTTWPLWSLRNDLRPPASVCLTTAGAPRAIDAVPLLVLARTACGLTKEGDTLEQVPDHDVLVELGKCLRDAIDPAHRPIGLNDQLELKTHDLSSVNIKGDEVTICATTQQGRFRNHKSSGQWLEDLVAVCVTRAAATAKLECECRIGVEIGHSPIGRAEFTENIGRNRAESDVLVRLGSDVFLFDCKTWVAGDRLHVQRLTAQARAEAISRFCIPVAVRPHPPASAIRDYRLAPSGAAVLGLKEILDLNLNQSLHDLVHRRRHAVDRDAPWGD